VGDAEQRWPSTREIGAGGSRSGRRIWAAIESQRRRWPVPRYAWTGGTVVARASLRAAEQVSGRPPRIGGLDACRGGSCSSNRHPNGVRDGDS